MPDPTEELREHESTYVVQDRSNVEEMTRLSIQDKMLTKGQGGVLEDVADPQLLQRVLDVGCGTGGWLMETAKTYPTIKMLVGVDISLKMVKYAQAQAESLGLGERVQFRTMDALRALDFREGFFDLINQRLGASWLRTWEWKKILLEYQRVARADGIIRITESDAWSGGNSPALTKLCNLILEAGYHSGLFFHSRRDGVTSELPRLMTQHGFRHVQTRVHTLVYRAGTNAHQSFYEDMFYAFRVALPFLQKWTNVPKDYQEIYQQALKEMQQPDFVVTWNMLTVWGIKPEGKPMLMRGLQ